MAPLLAVSLLLAVSSPLALASPLSAAQFPDWTITPPAAARTVEYADVPDGQRTAVIELVPDLVLGDEPGKPGEIFAGYPMARPLGDGRIVVLDTDSNRVQIFSPAGELLNAVGRRGQGPQDLLRATAIAATADGFVVAEAGNQRYNVWRLDGSHEGVVLAPAEPSVGYPNELHALSDGSFISLRASYGAEGERGQVISRFSLSDDVPPVVYAARRRSDVLTAPGGRPRLTIIGPSLTYAVGSGTAVYVTDREHHQVLKYDDSGNVDWALRVSREPLPYPGDYVERRVSQLRRRYPEVSRSDFDWPSYLPALSGIATDGSGRLYVFPYVRVDADTPPPARRPVDVYAPDGERIFAGWIRGMGRPWRDARDEHVYATDWDYDTEEWIAVRYRLVAPFE